MVFARFFVKIFKILLASYICKALLVAFMSVGLWISPRISRAHISWAWGAKECRELLSTQRKCTNKTLRCWCSAQLCVPCCRPGAGQCSCCHPAVSGQPWPGEGGWLSDIKTQRHLLSFNCRSDDYSQRSLTTDQFKPRVRQRAALTGRWLTHGATVSLVSSYHQSRASTLVHCVDLCPVAKHQLKSRDILSKCSSMQWGPTGTDRDGPTNYIWSVLSYRITSIMMRNTFNFSLKIMLCYFFRLFFLSEVKATTRRFSWLWNSLNLILMPLYDLTRLSERKQVCNMSTC